MAGAVCHPGVPAGEPSTECSEAAMSSLNSPFAVFIQNMPSRLHPLITTPCWKLDMHPDGTCCAMQTNPLACCCPRSITTHTYTQHRRWLQRSSQHQRAHRGAAGHHPAPAAGGGCHQCRAAGVLPCPHQGPAPEAHPAPVLLPGGTHASAGGCMGCGTVKGGGGEIKPRMVRRKDRTAVARKGSNRPAKSRQL